MGFFGQLFGSPSVDELIRARDRAGVIRALESRVPFRVADGSISNAHDDPTYSTKRAQHERAIEFLVSEGLAVIPDLAEALVRNPVSAKYARSRNEATTTMSMHGMGGSSSQELFHLDVITILQRIGSPAYDLLEKELDSSNDDVRSNAALALGRLGDRRIFKRLSALAARETREDTLGLMERKRYIWGLGTLGDTSAIPLLLDLLRGTTPVEVKAAVASSLGKLGAVEALDDIANLEGKVPGWETKNLQEALDSLRDRARAASRTQTASVDPKVDQIATQIAKLREVSAERATAARWLATYASDSETALTGLIGALDEWSFREEVVAAIGSFGGRARRALSALRKVLEQASRPVTREDYAEQERLLGELTPVFIAKISRREPIDPKTVAAAQNAIAAIDAAPMS